MQKNENSQSNISYPEKLINEYEGENENLEIPDTAKYEEITEEIISRPLKYKRKYIVEVLKIILGLKYHFGMKMQKAFR